MDPHEASCNHVPHSSDTIEVFWFLLMYLRTSGISIPMSSSYEVSIYSPRRLKYYAHEHIVPAQPKTDQMSCEYFLHPFLLLCEFRIPHL